MIRLLLLLSCWLANMYLYATPEGIQDKHALWITVPGENPTEYGVYYFRRDFQLDKQPGQFQVFVSGDNRYKLYVNEQLVSIGPARSDLRHWNYATVDLAPYLQAGNNVVAAVVWNDGKQRPEANISFATAFYLQGSDEQTSAINTNSTWKCIRDTAYSPVAVQMPGYYVAGPGERFDGHKHIAHWNSNACDLTAWSKAKPLFRGTSNDQRLDYIAPVGWLLQPSPIPELELKQERLHSIRLSKGIKTNQEFLTGKIPLTIPAHTQASLILDNAHLTNAYLTLNYSGGDQAHITIGYTEAFYEQDSLSKGNRNDIEGKLFIGRTDTIFPNGGQRQSFTTLAWRTYRYLVLTINTGDDPLTLNDVYGTFTGFPLQQKARLYTDDKELRQILEVGWRTARLCATETYMDCPYYEQLQYLGDSRIQALVTLYNSGDDRLVKNFLTQADLSRIPEGLTQSRYPTTTPQYIPPFSLWYICALHDYMMYGSDMKFVADKLNGVRQILDYFHRFQAEDGSVVNLPWWNFYDWVYQPRWNFAPENAQTPSHALGDLQLLLAYQTAADMEATLGLQELSDIYLKRAELLKQTIRRKYWCPERNLFADLESHDLFSQHTNSLAILTGIATPEENKAIAKNMLTDQSLAPASISFSFYLHQALAKAGLGDHYTEWLDIWRENLSMGLTTWGEASDVNATRSDCHAWGASPNIELFRILLGINSAAPGFKEIRIEPHLGNRTHIGGCMPHPSGMLIEVNYTLDKKGKLTAQITLPDFVTGTFIWKGKTYNLNGGKQTVITEN